MCRISPVRYLLTCSYGIVTELHSFTMNLRAKGYDYVYCIIAGAKAALFLGCLVPGSLRLRLAMTVKQMSIFRPTLFLSLDGRGNWFGFVSQRHYWCKRAADFGLYRLSYSGMQIDGVDMFLVAVVMHLVDLQVIGKFPDPAINGEVVGLFY